MSINSYLEVVNKRFRSGISREHAYRADLENLLRELVPGIDVTNEPANVTDCGNPDYVVTKKGVPIGFIEAKDVGKDLNGSLYKEQFARYRKALDNLILTDYIWFLFFQNGELVAEIRIGEVSDDGKTIKPLKENHQQFSLQINEFCEFICQTIKSPKKLAEMMAGKARLLESILEQAITSDEETQDNSSLKDQYETFKKILIHDLTPKAFSDIYAQTLAYGMFAARLHDKTLDTFTRQEAAQLIPKTNPFLRKLFSHVAGIDIDERIRPTVDNLANLFQYTNIDELLKGFGESTQSQDPIIHFYETFLAEYDPALRKSRGVWYTPQPVVSFIVRSVDEILKTEFNLKDGLAETSKTSVEVEVQGTAVTKKGKTKGDRLTETKEVHKVQVLDPATGTGTFLAEVIKFIYNKKFKDMQGAWSGYVEEDLIPRLNGFELLMASYAMAHLKLDMLLGETGYKPKKEQRFNVFLTNSLEEHHPDTGTLFSTWLSTEANEANRIKRDTPIMVVIGNPPYSVSSSNKGEWIQNLIADYKKDLNEKKINLDDDYIKFTRYGQHFINKNGSGILAYISANSFIDGVTHRQMRKNLLEDFDIIYVVDLHGNSKKKEISPDGTPDQNVFDIMQGVSINFFIKTGKKNKNTLAKVFHYDLYGKREFKYNFLNENYLKSLKWSELKYKKPYYFFVPRGLDEESAYHNGFKVDDLFLNKNTGIQTKNDSLTIQFKIDKIREIEDNFLSLNVNELKNIYGINEGTWKVSDAKADLLNRNHSISDILIKPFDKRYTIFNTISGGFLGRPRYDTMKHMLRGDNLALLLGRQNKSSTIDSFFITNTISEMKCAERTIQSYHFPLYLYPDDGGQQSLGGDSDRTPNLNSEIVNAIVDKLDLKFTREKENTKNTFAPIDILDYIYAVLHSPTYREKYKEFLKIDFPRVPYPKDKDTFWKLVKLGGEIRQIHLLESPVVEKSITKYPVDGDNVVSKPRFDSAQRTVFINEAQYFSGVPEIAWNFYIGGYQPAQKWLKDRKDRKLSTDEIFHYQKIIVALMETDRIMKEIDKITFE